MVADLTSLGAAVVQVWPDERLFKATIENNPFWAAIEKRDIFYGDTIRVALQYADIGGRSFTFANAQSQEKASANAKWLVTRANDYATAKIDGVTLRAMKKKIGAVIDALTSEMDSAMNAMNRSCGRIVYNTPVAVLGAISSGTASPVTMALEGDMSNFEVGMTIGAVSDATGSGTQRSGSGVITNINRPAKTITYTGTITGLTATDYLYNTGDYNVGFAGFRSWVPDSDPGATAFFNIDRTADIQRLGGTRYDATTNGDSIEEALQKAQARAGNYGGRPNRAWMNPIDVGTLQVALGTRAVLTTFTVGDIGFEGFAVTGPMGKMEVYADINAPMNRACLTDMSTWYYATIGKGPRLINDDGLTISRVSNADQYEVRLGNHGQPICTAPGKNCNVKLA